MSVSREVAAYFSFLFYAIGRTYRFVREVRTMEREAAGLTT